jgi:hypothetical protein
MMVVVAMMVMMMALVVVTHDGPADPSHHGARWSRHHGPADGAGRRPLFGIVDRPGGAGGSERRKGAGGDD